MKKILSVLFAVMLVFSLAACEEEKVEDPITDPIIDPEPEPETIMVDKSSFEIISELANLEELQQLPNLGAYGTDEESKERVSRYLSAMDSSEAFNLDNFVDGAILKPFMSIDARGILVLQFEDDSNKDEIIAGLENFAHYLICVQIQEYQIINVGNFYIFAGVQDNETVINAFNGLEFQRPQEVTINSSMSAIVSQLFMDSNTGFFGDTAVYNNQFMLDDLKYTFDSTGELNIDSVENGIMFRDYLTNELVFLMKAELNDDLRQGVANLKNYFVNMYGSDEVLESAKIIENGDYILFTSTSNDDALVEAFNSLNLK